MSAIAELEGRALSLEEVLELLEDVDRGILELEELRRRLQARARSLRREVKAAHRAIPATEVEVEELTGR